VELQDTATNISKNVWSTIEGAYRLDICCCSNISAQEKKGKRKKKEMG
jgi:hypothetical protein